MNICSQKKEITDARAAKRDLRTPKDHPPTEPPAQDLTGLICWWCVHALPQKPCIHLPIRYDDKRKIFSTIGNFCSWACAKAYALDMGTSRSGEIQMFLATMRMQSMGKFTPLWPAPKRQALKCFGGTMDIDEFRSFGGKVEPPQLFYPFERMYIAAVSNGQAEAPVTSGQISASGGARRMAAIENATAETDTLKLKRTKPLARTTSKLESALGIKRKVKE